MSMHRNNDMIVSTLHHLESSGVHQIQLMKQKNVLNLLQEELAKRLPAARDFHSNELDSLSDQALKEFHFLLKQYLSTDHSSSSLSVALNPADGENGAHQSDPFYVLHHNREEKRTLDSFFNAAWNE